MLAAYKKQGKLRLPPHDKNGIDSIDPEDSVSQVSHFSRTSRRSSVRPSASLIRLQEEQRQTELMTRADAVKEQYELEMARRQVEIQFRKAEEEYKLTLFEMKNKEEKLRLHTELSDSAAKLQALERYEEAEEVKSTPKVKFMEATHIIRGKMGLSVPSQTHTSTPHTAGQLAPCSDGDLSTASGHMITHGESTKDWMTRASSGTHTESYFRRSAIYRPANMTEQGQICGYPPTDHIAATSEILANVLDSLADRLSNREHLPKMMPEKFSGDLLQYPYWNQSFETIVEQHTNVVSQRMFFLGKCTVGEAHTAIQGYLALNTEEAYHKARAILRRRYGDKYTLAKGCKRKIRDCMVTARDFASSLTFYCTARRLCSQLITHSRWIRRRKSQGCWGNCRRT